MEVDREVVLRLLGGLRDCSRQVERGVREHPLDDLDVGILALAEASDQGLRPARVAEQLEVPFPSVTRHVQRLHRDGHVTIQPSADDRRGYQVAVTASGRGMLRDFRDHLVSDFAPVLNEWDSADVSALADGLNRLASSMTAAAQRAADSESPTSWWRATTSAGQLGEGGQAS